MHRSQEELIVGGSESHVFSEENMRHQRAFRFPLEKVKRERQNTEVLLHSLPFMEACEHTTCSRKDHFPESCSIRMKSFLSCMFYSLLNPL